MSPEALSAVAQYGGTPFAILMGIGFVIRSILWGYAAILRARRGKQ